MQNDLHVCAGCFLWNVLTGSRLERLHEGFICWFYSGHVTEFLYGNIRSWGLGVFVCVLGVSG